MNSYSLYFFQRTSKMDYKCAPMIPATLKIGLMFSPDRKCSDMEGSGTLTVMVKEARNLSSLSRATNLNRVWACSNLLPYQCLTSEKTTKPGQGDNPTWEHTFTYERRKMRWLLEENALEISVVNCCEKFGRVRLGGYPIRSSQHQPWMDSTEREAAHWEEVLSHPGKWVIRWHQIEESLDDRDVDLSKKPPLFIDPFPKQRLKYKCAYSNFLVSYE